jgi:hypothetical protein
MAPIIDPEPARASNELSNDPTGSGEPPPEADGHRVRANGVLAHGDDPRTWLRDEEAASSNLATPTR